MCKINGHSYFSYIFSPITTWKKKFNSKKKEAIALANKQRKEAEEQVEELNKPDSNDIDGEMPTPVVPTKTTGTGINTLPRVGLNL